MRVLVGGEVPLAEDGRVYDGGAWTGHEGVDGDVWLESLREAWGIKKDEIERPQGGGLGKGLSGDSDSEDDSNGKEDAKDEQKEREEKKTTGNEGLPEDEESAKEAKV